MKILASLAFLLLASEASAVMRCTQEFGQQVCRDDSSGETVRCVESFGETVCTNSRTGQTTRCRMIFNQYVCR